MYRAVQVGDTAATASSSIHRLGNRCLLLRCWLCRSAALLRGRLGWRHRGAGGSCGLEEGHADGRDELAVHLGRQHRHLYVLWDSCEESRLDIYIERGIW